MVGDGVPRLVERGFAATGGVPGDLPAQVETFLGIYEKAATVHTAPFPGVVTTLERLREAGHAMAVCTNKPYLATRAVLDGLRSEEHTSELQSLMRISYAVFCLKKKQNQ